jgi:hypothetical protein
MGHTKKILEKIYNSYNWIRNVFWTVVNQTVNELTNYGSILIAKIQKDCLFYIFVLPTQEITFFGYFLLFEIWIQLLPFVNREKGDFSLLFEFLIWFFKNF